jgi:hypothetical protein
MPKKWTILAKLGDGTSRVYKGLALTFTRAEDCAIAWTKEAADATTYEAVPVWELPTALRIHSWPETRQK